MNNRQPRRPKPARLSLRKRVKLLFYSAPRIPSISCTRDQPSVGIERLPPRLSGDAVGVRHPAAGYCGDGSAPSRSDASRSVRELTPSLGKIRCRWVLTVRWDR
jgi:hypothetical protein